MDEITKETLNDYLLGDKSENDTERSDEKNAAEEQQASTDETTLQASSEAATESAKQRQTYEQRRQNAAMRRAREREAQERAIQERIDAAYANAFSGQMNPYTGKAIMTEKDYRDYEASKNAEALESAGLSQNLINGMISEHPAVKRADELAREADTRNREAMTRRGQIELENEVRRISAIDPEIKTVDDLIRSENSERFGELISRGVDFVDAYRVANIDKLSKSSAARVKQEVINSIGGRSHMTSVGASSLASTQVEVPHDTAEMYRQLFPEMSAEEIRNDYNKRQKKKG